MDENVLKSLQNITEMDADRHDGSYELVRTIVEAFSRVDETELDYNDLNALYLMTVGTWKHGVHVKKKIIEMSHLAESSKRDLTSLIDNIQARANRGEYTNHSPAVEGNTAFGMFGTGFYSFEKKTDNKSVREFIKMCVDINVLHDDEEMFSRAAPVLIKRFRGMRAASASMVLHCLKPYTFPILNSNMGSESIYEALGIKLVRKGDIDTYIENCREIKAYRDANLPFKNYRILDMAAWSLDAPDKPVKPDTPERPAVTERQYWPSLDDYHPGISKDQWVELIKDNSVFNATAMTVMKRMLEIGGEATCLQLSKRFGNSPGFYNLGSSQLAKRVWQVTGCPRLQDAFSKLWPILYVGRDTDSGEDGSWSWKLRDELKEALEEVNIIIDPDPEIIEHDKNMILYGPPGTGKTYHTVLYAAAVIEGVTLSSIADESYDAIMERYNAYKDSGRIDFITFHQSFGYEDFIEGIKPVIFSDEDEQESTSISYKIENGIFKSFCERASLPKIKTTNDFGFNKNPSIWKVSLAGTGDNPIRRDCMKNGYIRIGWDEYGPVITDETDFKAGGKNVLNAFINRMQEGDIVLSCYSERMIDAIGVVEGQYEWHGDFGDYCRVRKVKWLVKNIKHDIFELNNETVMTLSTVYKMNVSVNDVVEMLHSYEVGNELFYDSDERFVFIIDEINRGNISKIFGELITLIEPTKRMGQRESLTAKLPYSKKSFGVPDNVYIIGTMNTADRSIALLDTALRRRFSFVEMQPDSETLEDITVDGLSISEMLNKINRRIEVLMDREHTIGHSYFLKLKDQPIVDVLANIFSQNILPLLQEYFYEDYEKIRLVLGDLQKDHDQQFIHEIQNDYYALFGATNLDFDEVPAYRINEAAFYDIEAYKGI